MTTQELADRLSIGYKPAQQLMASPGFPAVKIRSKWVVTEEAFNRWYRLNEGRAVLQPEPVRTGEKRSMHKVYKMDLSLLNYDVAKARLAK